MSGESPRGHAAPGPRAGGRRAGLAATTGASFSAADAVGGPRGVLEAVLPGVAFIAVLTLTRDLQLSLVLALAGSAVLLLARLVARLPLVPALSGAVGVAVCALAALRTGDAADFYLPGLFVNLAYASVLAASTVRWPRIGAVPVLGLVVGGLRGEGLAWRSDPAAVSLYRRLTWLWVGLFTLRLAVQLPLYLAGLVGPLAVARLAMGLPLFAAAAWLTWAALRRADPASASSPGTPAGGSLSEEAPGAPAGPPRSPRP